MISSRKSLPGGVSPVVVPHALNEIKDAVRELRHSSPDSVLISLAEQKIDRLERAHRPHRDVWNKNSKV